MLGSCINSNHQSKYIYNVYAKKTNRLKLVGKIHLAWWSIKLQPQKQTEIKRWEEQNKTGNKRNAKDDRNIQWQLTINITLNKTKNHRMRIIIQNVKKKETIVAKLRKTVCIHFYLLDHSPHPVTLPYSVFGMGLALMIFLVVTNLQVKIN